MELVHTPGNLFDWNPDFVCQLVLLRVIVWEEFMKGWIEKTNGGRQTF
jgi:hypothetical protein